MKKRKLEDQLMRSCIICGKGSKFKDLSSPRDYSSWETVCEAAAVRQFNPILTLPQRSETVPQNVFYHNECRSEFTHPKSLAKFTNPTTNTPVIEEEQTSKEETASEARHSMRQDPSVAGQCRVYEKTCIFCMKKSKYIKGTNTREALNPAVELRADTTIRDIAVKRLDNRILAITSRDIVAAEAHYHKTCYRDYTRTRPDTDAGDVDNSYQIAEKDALQMIFETIRNDPFTHPRIIPLADLTSQLVFFMQSKGIRDVTDSTKNHFRRNLESEFNESLHFVTVSRRVYVMPDNLGVEAIATEYILLKNKLETHSEASTQKSLTTDVALYLRDEIKGIVNQHSWPPHPEELNSAYLSIPDSLRHFLYILLGGKEEASSRIVRLTSSISQDIIAAVSCGRVLTPKHVLVPWVIKTLTGNVSLITTMNRLGHGCSYSCLEEIETALCIDKISTVDRDGVPLPTNIHSSIPSILAYDNIDRQEEVLSGAGTSHRVNGIIVQPTSLSCDPPKPDGSVNKKEKKRSIQPADIPLLVYTVGKRQGPPPIVPADLSITLGDASVNALHRNILWIRLRVQEPENQTICSWTGFNILTRNDIEVTRDTIAYLPTINAPATDMSTVQEILRNCIAIQTQLHLEKIAVVFDQALFAKAAEIAWKHQTRFGNLVLMMGNFHTICNLLSIIGKMFCDAGLRDIAVESGVIAEGSVNKVMEGKHYNRAVRFHKLTYEALIRLAWRGFPQWLETNHPQDFVQLENLTDSINHLHQNICQKANDDVLNNASCKKVLDLFVTYMNVLRYDHGALTGFWMIYVDLVEILLGLLRADREGDWNLHLSSIRAMIPWCFAMDKSNYARYLPVYYAQMTRLQETCPALYAHFQHGGFSVQTGNENPFGRIAVDQTTEETVNKDTQTAGGTRGFSLKPGSVSRYYLTAEYRAGAVRQLREFISLHSSGLQHADIEIPRIKRDESDVASMVDLLENNWTNPFLPDPSDLVNLSTGVYASADVASDLLSSRKKGEEAYQNFQAKRLATGEGFYDTLTKMKLKTFSYLNTKTSKGTNKEVILKADHRVFANMVLIAQNRKLDMRDVFCHPLGPLPWSLANSDGTLKKTNKSVLASHLESQVQPAEQISGSCAALIDAMALIHKLSGENHTFDELSDRIFMSVLHAGYGCDRLDVVFDVYRENSIKSAERVNRGSQTGVMFIEIRPAHKIKNWKRLLASTETKNKLSKFLAESWKDEKFRAKLGERSMFVTLGEHCFKLTKDECEEIPALKSNQEEADTRLLLHAKHAAEHYPHILCIADDTDVFIICLALSRHINSKIFIRRGTKARVRLVDVDKLAAAVGEEMCSALLGLHPWTGCDTVSTLAGQGKVKALKILMKSPKFTNVFASLGTSWNLSDDSFNTIQEFTCQLYCSNTKVVTVNELRYQMFRAKGGNVTSGQMPPCADTLLQHTLRANYQAGIWRRSLENFPEIPRPESDHGWTTKEGHLDIVWMKGSPAPEVVISLMSCKCPRSCRPTDCTCMLNRLKCTAACKLQTCFNMAEDEEDEEELLQNNEEDSCDSDT